MTSQNNPIPLDFYAARRAVAVALAAYPIVRNPDEGLTPVQRKKRHGTNFMAPERLTNIRVGAFTVEVATGVFMGDRMIGLTAFRRGGDLESDDANKCVHDLDEMLAHLQTLATPIRYKRGCDDYDAIRFAADHPEQIASEVTQEEYDDMLGAVPPIYVEGVPGFLVGEALSNDAAGTVYANYFISRDGKPCARYHRVRN